MPTTAVAAVHVAELEGRGRALVASRPIKPGEVILTDSPLLLYANATSSGNLSFCSYCFRSIQKSAAAAVGVSCPTCSSSSFCGPECLAQAQASSHSPWACHTLSRLRHLNLDPDILTQAHFLIAAYTLSPSNFSTLLSLQGGGGGGGSPTSTSTSTPNDDSHKLHSFISSSPPPHPHPGFSPDLTATLLAKDRMNAFGLMEPPFHPNDAAQRRVRAYAIYPNASFFNHDCLPNACRFDYIDSNPQHHHHNNNNNNNNNNTDIIVRALHDIPQGREVCLSYFPVNWTYSERQERLLHEYGFICNCDRCQVEKNWKDDDIANDDDDDDDDDDDMEDEDDNGMSDDHILQEQEQDGDDNIDDDFPHAYFFLRYQCERENCGGTLAPLPPTATTASDVMECNVCGQLTKAEPLGPANPENGDSAMLDD